METITSARAAARGYKPHLPDSFDAACGGAEESEHAA